MAKKSGWIARVGGHWVDEDGKNHRFEQGEPYLGPDPEVMAAMGFISPAVFDGGPDEPGDEPEGDEA